MKKSVSIAGEDGLRVQTPAASCAQNGTDSENSVSA
jgi:hypothetical protein